jgi:hypothetical protein
MTVVGAGDDVGAAPQGEDGFREVGREGYDAKGSCGGTIGWADRIGFGFLTEGQTGKCAQQQHDSEAARKLVSRFQRLRFVVICFPRPSAWAFDCRTFGASTRLEKLGKTDHKNPFHEKSAFSAH